MDYLLLVVYFFIAIGFSFLCSIAEAVLLSITPSYIAERRGDKSKAAMRIVNLKEEIDRPLSAILSLNTIAHTVGAAGVGAQATKIYGDRYVGVISAVLTLAILVLSEIIPKTIGAAHWRRLADPVAFLLRGLIVSMMPLVWLSEFLTKWLTGDGKQKLVTRDEIAAVAELGTRQGLLKTHETRIMRNLLKLESLKVEDVMTPSTVVIALEETQQLSELADQISSLPVSRIPLFHERRDIVTGFVLKDELLVAVASGKVDQPLKSFSREILAVHEDDSITVVFEKLLETRAHIAVVVDSFGGMEGIVTLEDVLETLLGLEIVDERDTNVDMQKLAREKWRSRLNRQGIQVTSSSVVEEEATPREGTATIHETVPQNAISQTSSLQQASE